MNVYEGGRSKERVKTSEIEERVSKAELLWGDWPGGRKENSVMKAL